MKKILQLSCIGLMLCATTLAQTIPNPGFENWNTITYENPDGWGTCNRENIRKNGPATVSKVQGVSNFAIRLETMIIAADTFQSYMSNTENDPSAGIGGVPFSQIPTHITGYFRYNLGATDTAILMVLFKSNGTIVSQDMIKIRGTGIQSTFASFSYPITLSVTPDTVIIAAASSNLIDNVGVCNGSFIEFDNLGFSGPGVTQSVANGTFDNWTTETINELLDWNSQGEGASKVSPGHSGLSCAQMITIDYGGGGIWGSAISIGEFTQNGPIGGIPYNHLTDTLCGYYKYYASGNDQSMAMVATSFNGMMTYSNVQTLSPTSSWTYFEIPINSFQIPDTLNILFSSSTNYPLNLAAAGSTLTIDDIWLKSQGVSIQENNSLTTVIKCQPNPAANFVDVSWGKIKQEVKQIAVYTIEGKQISKESLSSGSSSMRIDLHNYSSGKYLIKIITDSAIWNGAFVKQ